MISTKAIQLFQALDRPAKKQLQQLIQTKHTCPNADVRAFWGYFLNKKYLSTQNTSREKVFQHCFPTTAYEDVKLRRLTTLALKFLEENVRYFEKKETKINDQISRLAFHKEQGHSTFVAALFRNLEQEMAVLKYRDEHYYLQKYLLDVQKMDWVGQENRLESNNLQELTQNLTHFYTIATLKYACIGLTHQNLRQATYNIPLLESIIEQVEAKSMPTAVLVYYHAFKFLQDANASSHFQALKTILLEQPIQEVIQEPREVLLLAINHCIKRINSGDYTYIREAFELYLFGLERQILIKQGGFLSRFTFKNIIALALNLEEFEWTKQLIKAAPEWLEPAYVESQVNYNTAKLYFKQADYEKAMLLLQQAEFDDIFMNMDAKVMLLKMYYSTGNEAALEALLSSFDVFLHRKKILSYHRQNYQNIVRLLRKIVHTPVFETKARQQLQQQIETTKPLTEKAWLLEQLNESQ